MNEPHVIKAMIDLTNAEIKKAEEAKIKMYNAPA